MRSTTLDAMTEEQAAPPNKYFYPEFAGPDGERYLLSLAQRFAPFALWRTWQALVSYQAPGKECYVGVGRLVDQRKRHTGLSVGVKDRKIYLDLQAMEERGWLTMTRVRLSHVEDDGTIIHYTATVKDFTGFYATAHDYHLWLNAAEYIEPERENVALILADPELTKRLIRFENYRRLLLCGKPGPKKAERADYYQYQLEQLEQVRTGVQEVNHQYNPRANAESAYRVTSIDNAQIGNTSNLSTSEKRECASPMAIGRVEEQHTPPSNPQPNPPPPSRTRGAAAAEAVKEDLGYSEAELQGNPKKRGAAAVGISAEQYAKLHGGLDRAEREAQEVRRSEAEQERPRREIPASVSEEVTTYAKLYDDTHLVAGDVTRAKKLYATAEQALAHFTPTVFWAIYDEARKAAAKYAKKRHNSQGRVNRIPYLFTCLENALSLSLEELVYLRSDEPLYADPSLYEVIDTLRATHREQRASCQTDLDYREWLQCILDRLEKQTQPKERQNPTTRTQ